MKLYFRYHVCDLSGDEPTGPCYNFFREESICPYSPIDTSQRRMHYPMCCDADGCKCLCYEICPNKWRAFAAVNVAIPDDEYDECATLIQAKKMKEWKDNKCIETQIRNRSSVKEPFEIKFLQFNYVFHVGQELLRGNAFYENYDTPL